MKIAIFSDVHGNFMALEAVLQDIERRKADLVFCAGDLVGMGVFPNDVIRTIRERHIPTILGNYDEAVGYYLADGGISDADSQLAKMGRWALAWTKQQVIPENKAFLRGLLSRIKLKLYNKNILIVHGSPARNTEYYGEAYPEASIKRVMELESTDILICGHTHIPAFKRIGKKYFINAGSIGYPKDGDSRAAYVLVNVTEEIVETEIIKVEYDLERTLAAMELAGLPQELTLALRKAE
ncbi:MAG TPA: metallophosphoesterase family protein [Bacillota bacterium]|nr:metallophosphoesterase family protein [Bacillota bacterium]